MRWGTRVAKLTRTKRAAVRLQWQAFLDTNNDCDTAKRSDCSKETPEHTLRSADYRSGAKRGLELRKLPKREREGGLQH